MASGQTQSESAKLREKGNEFYREAGDGVSPSLQVERLLQAITHYGQALDLSKLPEERSSAHKNMAMAYWKMAKATENPNNVLFYLKGALKHFQEAKKKGADRDYTWNDSLAVSVASCWSDIHYQLDGLDFQERVRELEQLVPLSIDQFTKVLKIQERAKTCLMKELERANTMVSRNITGAKWYEFTRSTVERFQQEQVPAEEEKHQKDRGQGTKPIKDEIDVIKEKLSETEHGNMSKLEFLKFLYTTHPPKNPEHKLGEVSSTPEWSELKKLYQKAVIHYHPDKVRVDEHGVKWKALTEDITKLLNGQYEFYRGCCKV